MTDIVERLKKVWCEYEDDIVACEHAAAEIENLRKRNETLQAEVERLRRQVVMR
jgi:cell division protein FtsB